MLSFDRIRKVGLGLATASLVAACIQPLYGPRNTSSGNSELNSVRRALAEIEIEPAGNRIDQQLRNNLIFSFTGGSSAPSPRYKLKISTTESVQSAVVDPFTSRPTTETFAFNATYSLSEIGVTKTKPLTGQAFGRASYDRSRQRFASLRARRDAEDRAAQVVAQQIATQLSAYFATRR